jgi:outer membrane lipoprotein SlyB
MSAQLCRKRRLRRLIALAAILWSWTSGIASAQATDQRSMRTPSQAVVKARVPAGDVVYVTDTTGATIKGTLAAVTDEAVQVYVRRGVRSVAAADVRRIQWQQPDSPITGALIGAAIGAIPGIYWLAVDPNECTGMCPEEYALIAIGAVVGAVIDHAIKRKVTVYAAGPSSGRAKSVMIGPLVMRDRKGVQVAVKF